jgi:putative ABC transport system permease protein
MGWSRFFRRGWWDDERARELESYLDIETDENIARGMTPADARLAARRKLGNVTRTREVIYEMNTITFLETVWQDLRYGLRLLRRNAAFAVIAIGSLALGTGANTAIFQLVNAIRLRALPVANPHELALIMIHAPEGRSGGFHGAIPLLTNPLFEQLKARQQAFSSMAAWGSELFDLSSGGTVRPAKVIWVNGEYFKTLGTRPALGRLLTAEDDRRGGPPIAVLSHAFWLREFGGDPSVLGRSVPLDGHAFEIVGVTPAGFNGVEVGRTFDVAVPLATEPMLHPERPRLDGRAEWFLAAIGRLKPDWTIERANAHLTALSPDMMRATVSPGYGPQQVSRYLKITYSATASDTGVSMLRRQYEQPLWILLAITGLVLLIACANLANLMLARATVREREVAVRLAIGASRLRIVRQLLSESLLLAAAGTLVGIVIAQWLSRFLITFIESDNSPTVLDLAFDWRMFAFTATLAGGACLLFGLAPALRATRSSPGVAMKAGGRTSTDARERFGLRRALVVLQVALSLVLVVGALLFVRSLHNLLTQPLGFRDAGLVIAQLDAGHAGLKPEARTTMYRQIIERVRAIPGVDDTSDASSVPLSDSFWNETILIDGQRQPDAIFFNRIGSRYFAAMDIGVVSGRTFNEHDAPATPLVAIVNESFVAKYLANRNPLGQMFQIEESPGTPRPFYQIVGVVKDTKYDDLRDPFAPIIFIPSSQSAKPGGGINLLVRSSLPAAEVMTAVTRAVGAINPSISITFDTMRAQIDRGLLRERLMAWLSGLFGALAALIATIGLYGVMSYMVARRRTEIGIRMALGADRPAVIKLITGEAGLLVGIGIIVGALLAIGAARAAHALLFGLQPWDPTTLAMAAVGLGAVAAIASWLPAHRASRLDPTTALREE